MNKQYNGQKIPNRGFLLPIWYLLAIVMFVHLLWILITYLVSFGHCVVCSSSMDSDYLFGIFWPLPIWYLLAIVLFVHLLWIMITYLVSFGHCVVCSSSMDSDYLFGRRTNNTMAKRYQIGNQNP
jgi:hypothetical protein